MRMSKPGIHKNKWSKGGGSYWREEAYYSITAKIGHEENENDKRIRKINKVRDELMQKLIVKQNLMQVSVQEEC